MHLVGLYTLFIRLATDTALKERFAEAYCNLDCIAFDPGGSYYFNIYSYILYGINLLCVCCT